MRKIGAYEELYDRYTKQGHSIDVFDIGILLDEELAKRDARIKDLEDKLENLSRKLVEGEW